ncbi:tyrosine-type recombinase/integrase [Nisaea acidiphila]|uniref:Tyrosine-type recombinase/integrase n=1 Tax=Nisaea acidiphila TaxID=1862145 RepID=A0A9J7AKT1_9PROT|nr:DUF6538 domain-containing protein [Nisaea acidiphila]UUX48096.1 tyrosine-type recombinase/integrase [Nisaea acidiphila]
MILRLPYLTSDRKTGNYTYRRAVPKDLREALGRREINHSLGTKDRAVALRKYHPVHQQAERLLKDARSQSSPGAVARVAREHLNNRGFKADLPLNDPAVSPLERELRIEAYEDLHDRSGPDGEQLPRDEWRLYDPAAQPEAEILINGYSALKIAPTLREGIEIYLVERGREPNASLRDKRYGAFQHRVATVLAEVLTPLGDRTPIDKITREDALRWRTHALGFLDTGTVDKHLKALRAQFRRLYETHDIDRRNPFESLDIPKSKKRLARDNRLPFTPSQEDHVRSLLPKMNEDAQLVLRLLMTTGCRQTEACHLVAEDIVLDGEIAYIHIRPNERNGWLVKGSFARRVPIVDPETLELIRKYPDGPSRYHAEDGPTNFSTATNKFLRENGLSDGNVSVNSSRHTMKKKLMAVEAPASVIDEIMGHSSGAAKEVYGDGLPLEVSARWLRAALGLTPGGTQEPPEAATDSSSAHIGCD